MNVATILLAAGQSARLGEPKQLLEQHGVPLVRHMAQLALDLAAGPVVVVIGAHGHAVREALHGLSVRIQNNPDWEGGMGSSLRVGVSLVKPILPDAILVLLTDQPHVSRALLERLIETAQSTHKPIVASQYGDVHGVPVLFRPAYFDVLTQLSGDTGARKIVQNHPDDVATIPFPDGQIDLDTPEDVAKWKRGEA